MGLRNGGGALKADHDTPSQCPSEVHDDNVQRCKDNVYTSALVQDKHEDKQKAAPLLYGHGYATRHA